MTSDHIDFYGIRLAKVNETNPVRANNDICNASGVKLVAQNDRLSIAKIEIILKHKLTVPLEQQIGIDKSLGADDLYKLLIKTPSKNSGLGNILDSEEILTSLKHFCTRYEKFPLLRQKLTVLQHQLPKLLDWSLFSAITGLVIAIEMDLNKNAQETAFIGGLMHNIGYLHLDPDIVGDGVDVENNINTACQLHTKIAKIFLDEIPGLPLSVGDAVGDHHERTDGTGYPKHKMGAKLSMESQIIAMTDLIHQGFQQYKKFGGDTLNLIFVKLQLNDNIHFEEVYKAAVKSLLNGSPIGTPVSNVPSAVSVLAQRRQILEHFEIEKKVALVLMKNLKIKSVRSIGSMVGRLASSLCSSGMVQNEYEEWLKDLTKGDSKADKLDLLKSHIMQEEIHAQLERLKHLMNNAIQHFPEDQSDVAEALVGMQAQLKKSKF